MQAAPASPPYMSPHMYLLMGAGRAFHGGGPRRGASSSTRCVEGLYGGITSATSTCHRLSFILHPHTRIQKPLQDALAALMAERGVQVRHNMQCHALACSSLSCPCQAQAVCQDVSAGDRALCRQLRSWWAQLSFRACHTRAG